MRSVDRKLTFWMAGYYDDFMSARTLPDDFNTPSTTWSSSKNHHGNPLNGWAVLNTRYTYAWCERGDGASGRFNNAAIATADQYNHNAGIHEWLTYDQNRRNAGKYEGMAQLQYPDSLTNANRQKFDGGTGLLGEAYKTADAKEAYLLFSYAHNTGSRYYAAVGTNDSSYGRATSKTPDYDGGSTNTLDALAGIPTGVATPTTVVRTHLAGVYSGEVLYNNAYTDSNPKAMLYPIQSPAGKPFLVSEVYTVTTSDYTPILSFDGTLNSKGDGDIFTIRMHACAVATSTANFKLSIGCEGTAFTSVDAVSSGSSSGDTGYSNAAITLDITPSAYQETTSWTTPPTLTSLWDDYDFVIDYTNNRYTLYKNGTAVVTNQAMSNKADGSNFTPSDMYGWMITARRCSKKAAVLIDRVGLVRPLNDYPSGIEMPPAVSMGYTSAVNSVSQLNLTLIDDDSQLNLLEFFNASSYADWSLLMFRDAVDRPIWRGSVKSLNYNMSAVERTPTIKLTASDNFEPLDQQIPTWELGDGGDADSTSVVEYNRSEAQNNLNTYYFGASRLISANASLGFNEVDDGSGVFLAHKDSRMRNRSAHPIQMYNDQDTDVGPNSPYADWDAAIVAGDATASAQYRGLHSRWMQDFKNSLWFRHMFGKIQEVPTATMTLVSDFTAGSTTMTLSDTILSVLSGGSIEIINTDGTVDSGIITSAVAASSASIVAIDWVAIGSTVGTVRPYQWFPIIYVPSSIASSNLFDKVISIEGSSNANLNGTWKSIIINAGTGTTVTRNGTTCYPLGLMPTDRTQLNNTSVRGPFYFMSPPEKSTTSTNFLGQSYSTNPTGRLTNPNIGVSRRRLDERSLGEVWSTENTAGTIKYGAMTATLPATNFFQRNHSAGAIVNVRSHSDDYKHVWVMWADMRNDGSANADQGFRKKDFGLMAPYAQNYSVSMVLADSTVSNDSERQEFVDLSIGSDVDLWQMDATKDPITGNTWSSANSDSYTPASFSGSVNDRYHNWENKAGSFVFVDASKFFNLNTESNGGKTGQTSGGRKEVGDYLVETEGFPVLIDNYWERAPTGPYNLDEADYATWNTNYKFFNSRATVLTTGIEVGDEIIQLNDDIIKIPAFPAQQIPEVAGKILSHSKDKIWHFNLLTHPDPVASVLANADGAGKVKLTAGTSSTYLTKFRKGHRIKISNSTTSPSIDGEYTVTDYFPTTSGSAYVIEIQIADATATITGGTCTVVGADYTYEIRTLADLGLPKVGTTTAGEWNGAGYGSGSNHAEYLIQNYSPISSQIGSQVDIPIGETESGTTYDDATVYVGLANVFPMRLMMQVDGFIENRGSLTFNDSDKFRVAWLDSLTYNWLAQSALYGIPSLASIPNTGRMTTTQKSAINDAEGSFIASTTTTGTLRAGKVSIIVNSSGPDPNLQDGDVIEIYGNSELSKEADDYRSRYVVSDVGTNGSYNFDITLAGITTTTNNEGYWRRVGTFDDFGQVNDCRNSTIANIFSTTQAGAGIGANDGVRSVMSWLMGRDSQPSYRPTYNSGFEFNDGNLRVSSLSTESTNQISNVRVFYNGSTSFVDYPQATLNTRPRWEIVRVDSVTSRNEALIIAKQEYEKNKAAPFSVSAQIIRFSDAHTMDGLNDVMLYNARYGYVADQSRTIPRTSTLAGAYTEDKAWAWASLWGGNLFSGIQNALDGRDGPATQNTDTQSTLNYDDNYYWYGANSVSYAVQVVDIPQGMPKSTQKTAASGFTNADGNLRIAIDIDDRYGSFLNPENAVFRIYLLDYDWRSLPAGSGVGGPNLIEATSVSVSQNGLYQLSVPDSYWNGNESNVIISVNHDYLVSLLRQRCGSSNTHLNAHDWSGVSYGLHNTDSIFPLGVHKFGQADYWNHNSEWYAPRLHIVDDVNFAPATTVTYTDARMGLTNEKLSIKSLNWSISSRDTETLNITLERDVSRAAKNFASYILPKVARGGTQSSGQGNQGGGGSTPPQTAPSDGATTGGRGGDNAGNPQGGGWQDWGGWGDTGVAQTSSSQLNPITTPNRIGGPDGISTAVNGVHRLSSSAMGNTTLNRVKGTMNFNNDSVTGGSFGVLGQTKPSVAPRDNSGVAGIDSFMTPTSGDAIMGDEGMVFAGGGDWVPPPTIFTVTAKIPPNSQSREIRVMGRASMGAASGSAVLLVTVECVETGVKETREVTVGNVDRANVVLFSGIISGAEVSNNTIVVSIERNAGQGSDSATYSSLTLHSVELSTDNRSVAGSSESNSYTYSE